MIPFYASIIIQYRKSVKRILFSPGDRNMMRIVRIARIRGGKGTGNDDRMAVPAVCKAAGIYISRMLKFTAVYRLMSERGGAEAPAVREKARRKPDETGRPAGKCAAGRSCRTEEVRVPWKLSRALTVRKKELVTTYPLLIFSMFCARFFLYFLEACHDFHEMLIYIPFCIDPCHGLAPFPLFEGFSIFPFG